MRLAEKPLCKYPMDGHGGSAVPNAVPSGGTATWIRCSGRHTTRWYVRIVGRSLSATAIRRGYTAPGNATPWHGARGRMWMDEYRKHLIAYQTTMSIVREMLKRGIIIEGEYHKIDTIIAQRHSISLCSIFR